MKKSKERIVSLILCVLLCLSVMPVPAFARDGGPAVFASGSETRYARNAAAPKITTQPKAVTTSLSATVSLTVKASGRNLKYQWYYRTSASKAWKKLSGRTASQLTFTAKAKHNGYQYRCRVSNSGGKVYSKAVTLTVLNFTVKTQPESRTAARGAEVRFETGASGSARYQWYYRTSKTGIWKALDGRNTAVLTFTAAAKHDGYQYRCRITNTKGGVYTKTATLRVTGFSITRQPRDQGIYRPGGTVRYTVKTEGAVDRYQWYCRTSADAAWQAVEADGTENTRVVEATPEMEGYQYRCKLTDAVGSVYTSPAALEVFVVHYRALLVGESQFHDDSLNPAERNRLDVEMMEAMLNGIRGPDGADYQVSTLLNAGTEEIGAAIGSAFAGAGEHDVSLFFIASHGVVDCPDGDQAGAIVTVGDSEDDFLTMPQLAAWLGAVPGEVIVMIGSCGSGAAIYSNGLRSEKAADPAAFTRCVVEAFAAGNTRKGAVSNVGDFRTSKFYVLTAAAHQEESWGYESSGNLFTRAITKGVNGSMPADTGKNGTVSLQELYDYVRKQTAAYQTTQAYPEDSGYELFKKK